MNTSLLIDWGRKAIGCVGLYVSAELDFSHFFFSDKQISQLGPIKQ